MQRPRECLGYTVALTACAGQLMPTNKESAWEVAPQYHRMVEGPVGDGYSAGHAFNIRRIQRRVIYDISQTSKSYNPGPPTTA